MEYAMHFVGNCTTCKWKCQ